jgi:hypothetical protein
MTSKEGIKGRNQRKESQERITGWKEGREEGRKEERKKERKEGRKEDNLEEGFKGSNRSKESEEGRNEGRTEGRKDGRKELRTDGRICTPDVCDGVLLLKVETNPHAGRTAVTKGRREGRADEWMDGRMDGRKEGFLKEGRMIMEERKDDYGRKDEKTKEGCLRKGDTLKRKEGRGQGCTSLYP